MTGSLTSIVVVYYVSDFFSTSVNYPVVPVKWELMPAATETKNRKTVSFIERMVQRSPDGHLAHQMTECRVAQWVVLSLHSKKGLGSIPNRAS